MPDELDAIAIPTLPLGGILLLLFFGAAWTFIVASMEEADRKTTANRAIALASAVLLGWLGGGLISNIFENADMDDKSWLYGGIVIGVISYVLIRRKDPKGPPV